MFDPHGTLGRALWIGGGQWAGKSTVAHLLATRHGLTAYRYDFHDARGHDDRRLARRVRRGEPLADPTPDQRWVRSTPGEMAREALAGFPIRFEWALDDLRALVSPSPVIAEGWGLRPELVAPLLTSATRTVVLAATEAFRRRQVRTLPRARALGVAPQLGDPDRAQANRPERDRLVEDAARAAERLGMAVIRVDGSRDAAGVADIVARHFAPHLPAPVG